MVGTVVWVRGMHVGLVSQFVMVRLRDKVSLSVRVCVRIRGVVRGLCLGQGKDCGLTVKGSCLGKITVRAKRVQ